MSVKKETSGRRSVQVEVVVPGTPEEVWQAIATGPGISSWFVPTTFEESDGRPVAVTSNFGPGLVPRSAVTAWDPPRMFAAQGEGWGGSPPIATEWSVEARAGGVCLVRVVHSLFASTDDWDNQLEATGLGWPGFFRTLRIYLTHFRGQRSELMQFRGSRRRNPKLQAWGNAGTGGHSDWKGPMPPLAALGRAPGGCAGLLSGVAGSTVSQEVRTDVSWCGSDKPGPGVAALGAFDMGGQSMVALSLYHYGDRAAETVARETPLWQAWFQRRFPMPTEPGKSE